MFIPEENKAPLRLLSTNCLSVFDQFVGLALKNLTQQYYFKSLKKIICKKEYFFWQ